MLRHPHDLEVPWDMRSYGVSMGPHCPPWWWIATAGYASAVSDYGRHHEWTQLASQVVRPIV
jgi:hypothetical protein